MAYSFYAYLVLIEESSNFEMSTLLERLRNFYIKDNRAIQLSIDDNLLTLGIESFQFHLQWHTADSIRIESEELASNYLKNTRKRNRIASCSQRIEISADDDPNMSYFNDSLYLLDELSFFKGVHIFDPQAGTFLDEL